MIVLKKQLKLTREITSTLIIIAFLLVWILQTFAAIPMRVSQIMILALGGVSFIIPRYSKDKNYFFGFCFVYTFFGIISWLYNKNADIQEYLWIIGFGGIAYIMLYSKLIFSYISFAYYSLMSVMLLLIGISNGVDNVQMASSRNNISVIAIFLLGLYFVEAYRNNKHIPMRVVLLFCIVSFLGIGRSGFLLAALALIVCSLWDVNKKSFLIKNPIRIIGILCVLLIIGAVIYETVIYPVIYNIMWRGVVSQVRLNIWESYLNKARLSFMNIVFGANVSGNYWLDIYSDNLHNSFLNLHSKYGLTVLIINLVLIFNALAHYIKDKNIALLFPFLLLILRSMTDYVLFNGCGDVLFYFMIFYPIVEKRKALK